jgi:DNA repair protein RecN (Recombination protein N)
MIAELTIRNFALIERLSVEFCRGLNVFTGETGAGKSILIDALRFCLGERLQGTQVRDAAKPCVVEAVFDPVDEELRKLPLFSEYLQDSEPILIINRTYLPDGRSRNKINGFTVTVSRLKEVGNHLVDFHGPHEHQMLFSEDSHIAILDRLSAPDGVKKDYVQRYDGYLQLEKELKELRALADNREREEDMLRYQIKELEQVPLDTAAYEELLQEHARVNNAEKLYECARRMIDILENEETGISDAVSRAFVPMKTLNDIDEATAGFADILMRMQEDSSELLSALRNYLDGLSFQPEEADEINKRYDVYYEILRKYGPTLAEARKFYEEAGQRYDTLVNLEHNDTQLQDKIKSALQELKKSAGKITGKRKKAAENLNQTIEKELRELGIRQVRFDCRIEKAELNRKGQDKVVFYISPNVGEDLKPLQEIISSGEASRVMLALKKALTKVDPIPVLIFDEIDAQIGGRLGAVTGRKLKELSQDRQVILITHLPQIASFGDCHFKVAKKVRDNRTVVELASLNRDGRIEELAKMMSGEEETRTAVKHAREMLARAKKHED